MIDSHGFRKREDQGEFRRRRTLDGFLTLDFLTHPYTVPYGVMVPHRVDGLLVPVAVSATHLGFCTLRMEPCWMALGQAAGTAAHLCRALGVEPRDVPVPRLQRELLRAGAVLIYYNDLNRRHPQWEGLQYVGVRGFLPGLFAYSNRPVSRGEAARWLRRLLPDSAAGEVAVTYRDLRQADPGGDAILHLASLGVFSEDLPADEFRSAQPLSWKDLDRWLHRAVGARLASLSVRPRPGAQGRPYLRRGELAQALYEALAPLEDSGRRPPAAP